MRQPACVAHMNLPGSREPVPEHFQFRAKTALRDAHVLCQNASSRRPCTLASGVGSSGRPRLALPVRRFSTRLAHDARAIETPPRRRRRRRPLMATAQQAIKNRSPRAREDAAHSRRLSSSGTSLVIDNDRATIRDAVASSARGMLGKLARAGLVHETTFVESLKVAATAMRVGCMHRLPKHPSRNRLSGANRSPAETRPSRASSASSRLRRRTDSRRGEQPRNHGVHIASPKLARDEV